MSQGTVEERLDRLEKAVKGVVNQLSSVVPRKKDWRRTIGMFDGDPVMGEIIEDALRTRDEERQQFYQEHDRGNGPS
jgi:hypothetical protein